MPSISKEHQAELSVCSAVPNCTSRSPFDGAEDEDNDDDEEEDEEEEEDGGGGGAAAADGGGGSSGVIATGIAFVRHLLNVWPVALFLVW